MEPEQIRFFSFADTIELDELDSADEDAAQDAALFGEADGRHRYEQRRFSMARSTC